MFSLWYILKLYKTRICGSGGIRTHAIEMTGALNQRLRPLGHATYRGKGDMVREQSNESFVSTYKSSRMKYGDLHFG